MAGLIDESSSISNPLDIPCQDVEHSSTRFTCLGGIGVREGGREPHACCRRNVAVDAAGCAGECGTVVPRPHWAAWAACYEPALPLSVCLMSGSRPTSCACTCFCVSFGHGFETFVTAIDTYRLGSVGQTSPQKPKWCSGALPRCDFQPPSPAERALFFVES